MYLIKDYLLILEIVFLIRIFGKVHRFFEYACWSFYETGENEEVSL